MIFIGCIIQALLTIGIVKDVLTAPMEKKLTIDEIIVNKTHTPRDGTIIDDKFVLIQHDMLLTKQQYQEMYGKTGQMRKRGNAGKGVAGRWPYGVIPYEFAPNLRGDKNIVLGAMQEWQSKSCIKFRPRTSTDRNYINIIEGKGCSSHLGMAVTDVNRLTLEYPGCWTHPIALHELGHAIGLHHEQQHPDAGNYIAVNYQNIAQDCHTWYRPHNAANVDTFGSAYDIYSIMHYGINHCSTGGPAFNTKDPSKQNVPGQGNSLSVSDVQLVNVMYNYCRGTSSAGCKDAKLLLCRLNKGYYCSNLPQSCLKSCGMCPGMFNVSIYANGAMNWIACLSQCLLK